MLLATAIKAVSATAQFSQLKVNGKSNSSTVWLIVGICIATLQIWQEMILLGLLWSLA